MTPSALLLLLISPAMGSFAHLLADRAGTGAPWAAARSRCDGCGRTLSAWDLVPILSWLVLRGRARCCGARLRPSLLAAEAGALALALWAVAAVPGPLLWPTAALGWVLLALSLVDLRLFRLPDAGTLPLLAAGLALSAAGLTGPLPAHALAAALGYAAFAGLGLAWQRLRGVEALGLGDAKLLAAAGAWAGPAALPSVVLIGAGIGLGHALLMRLSGRPLGPRTAIPFGPGLAAGFWVSWVHGPLVLG